VASLCTGHFDSTNQKLFEQRFPSYSHGDGAPTSDLP
jgi:hypothetical protein